MSENETTSNGALVATDAPAASPTLLPLGNIAQILSASDLETQAVPVPQWGCSVLVTSLSKRRQQELRKKATVRDGKGRESVDSERLEMFLFIESVSLESGERFNESHYGQLVEKSAAALDSVLKVVLSLNGLTEEAQKAAEDRFPA